MSPLSLSPSLQAEIDALVKDISQAQPKDVVQHCANYFNRRLESDRSTQLARNGVPTNTTNTKTKMADTAQTFNNPFGSSKKTKAIQEEDEEHDSFGSPSKTVFRSSPFQNSSARGTNAGATSTGGGLFGNWMNSQGISASSESTDNTQSTPTNYAAGRRTSVSAESMQPDADPGNWKPPKHSKTPEQLERLKKAVANNFLFSQLDEESFALVLDALVEKAIPAPNIKVISQGDEGDYFYVIESGDFGVYINQAGSLQPGQEGMGNKVASLVPGNSFGELALMYNAPRAATIVSAGKGGMLWALDRLTFRKILMDRAFQRRKMYEKFLEDVPLLQGLEVYDRAKIADALESVKFTANDKIITEGDPGDCFYILEDGQAAAHKSGIDKPVKDYHRGDFFGELALLDDKPRAASVLAVTNVKVARLGRDGFKRLLGPVENIMRREEYDAGEGLDPLQQHTTAT